MKETCLVWFRRDLRLADNAALTEACRRYAAVIPVFILAEGEEKLWKPGEASRWWLHQSLKALAQSLSAKKSRLILRRGNSASELKRLIRETKASAVYWNAALEPHLARRDRKVHFELVRRKINALNFHAGLLIKPSAFMNKQGKPYQVFTPFYKQYRSSREKVKPLAAPRRIPKPAAYPKSLPLEALKLEPRLNWVHGLQQAWRPGETAAHKTLRDFLSKKVTSYPKSRDIPSQAGTSRLSPYLHFGEISPQTVWVKSRRRNAEPFLRQLIWREFSYYLLHHFPKIDRQNMHGNFNRMAWAGGGAKLKAWQKGRTGYPIVDAGMRELWRTGWMHNRVRMVVASFLTKDLMIHWRKGAGWFWDTLVDADLANNTMGWQWVAGCGADAAPFFRIFNPVLQGMKYDAKGAYVRKWIPEIKALPDTWIHRPWEAPPEVLKKAGLRLGEHYPKPIVNHDIAKKKALAAYSRI